MRIVIDGRLLLPSMTGIGRYLLGLSRALNKMSGDEMFELWLQADLQESHPIWSLAGKNFTLRKMNINHMNVQQQWVIPRDLHRNHPEVFHYPHFDLPFLVPGAVVATIHDLKYISQPSFFPRLGSAKRLLMWVMMGFSVRRAQKVIAVSESTRQDILRFLGANPDKIVVIPEGVEVRYFETPTKTVLEDVRDRYNLLEPFILFVGERRPHKNISGLIRAFDIFLRLKSHPHHLVIVGKHYIDYREPERLVSELGIKQHVHFIEYVPEADLPSFYWLSDVFATLSLYEGVGLPVLEAMASGTPVVAALKTSLPEVVGDAGLLVDPGNLEEAAHAIERVISDSEQRERYIEKGLLRAHQFTWERCAKMTRDVYKQVVNL